MVEFCNSDKLRKDKTKKLNIRTRWEPHIQIDGKYGSIFGSTYIHTLLTPKSQPSWLAFRILSSTSVQTPRTPPDSAPEHNGENSITLLLSSFKLRKMSNWKICRYFRQFYILHEWIRVTEISLAAGICRHMLVFCLLLDDKKNVMQFHRNYILSHVHKLEITSTYCIIIKLNYILTSLIYMYTRLY